jgi:hypothetical protein
VLDLIIRLYLSARAHLNRMADFLSNSFQVSLIPQTSRGYYNNIETDTLRRMAASLLENAFFSKSILQQMLKRERLKIALYAALWFLALLNRATDVGLITAVAQVLFSEQIISRWLRMEWLRSRTERVFDETYSLLMNKVQQQGKEFSAQVLDSLLRYETGKAQAGISLSTKLFKRLNPSLTQKWQETSRVLGLAAN